MDHLLQLHVEHHSSLSLENRDCDPGVGRLRKGVDASRAAVLALGAVASLALILPPAWLLAAAGSLVTTRTALFLLSNAILALLAADCRWFFAAGASASDVADACELPGGALEKQQAQRHQEEARRCAAKPCVTYSDCPLQDKINSGTASEKAFTEPVMTSGSTTTLEVLEEQEDVPAMTRSELLGLLEGDSITVELETAAGEPACETGGGLDELEIDELNRKFDEFIQSRRNKWIKEEAYLQWNQA